MGIILFCDLSRQRRHRKGSRGISRNQQFIRIGEVLSCDLHGFHEVFVAMEMEDLLTAILCLIGKVAVSHMEIPGGIGNDHETPVLKGI